MLITQNEIDIASNKSLDFQNFQSMLFKKYLKEFVFRTVTDCSPAVMLTKNVTTVNFLIFTASQQKYFRSQIAVLLLH